MRFDHVAVLVPDLDAACAFARDTLGLGAPVREFTAPEHGLAGAFFAFAGGGQLEVFTLDGATAGRLPDGAPGVLDHVAVQVDDLEGERDRLAATGVSFTGPQRPDAVTEPVELGPARHLWTDPVTSGGVRVQLIERPAP